MQLAAMQDEHMVQAFPFQAADEALADRVGFGCSNRCLEHLDIRAIGNTRKQRTVLVVPIADEIFGTLAPGSGFAQLLGGLCIGGGRR